MSVTAAQLLARLAAAFPRERIEKPTLDVYLAQLADIPPDVLSATVDVLLRSSAWFPTIQAIRAAAAELTLSLPGEADALGQVTARMEWARIKAGGDPPPVDPLVRQAVNLVGGYHAFRAADNATIVRGQFLRVYADLRSRAVYDAQVWALPTPAATAAIGPPPPAADDHGRLA